MIKLTLLGHGSFAQPSFDKLRQEYQIVDQDKADCLIVANYGHILTQKELEEPKYGAINIHGSLLPKLRGSSPIQTAIADFETETGITLIKMDSLVDHGPILALEETTINPDETTEDLRKRLGLLAATIISPILKNYFNNKLQLIEQDEAQATYTKKIKLEDGELKSGMNPNQMYNTFRAFKDEPGAYFKLGAGDFLKIKEAKLQDNTFIPLVVQRSGRQEMPFVSFTNGFKGTLPLSVDR